MSVDDEQNRRITDNAKGVSDNAKEITRLSTEQALTRQSVDSLKETFDTGMTTLNTNLKERDDKFLESRKQERVDASKEADKAREQDKWFWGKVFGIVGTFLTLGSAGGATAWYAMEVPVERAAPAPVPLAEPLP